MRVSKHPKQRRAELVAAARRLFDLHGVENTRVSDIVRQVGVAQGVFYYYFRSKEEMVEEVVRQVNAELDQKAASIVNDTGSTFCQKLSGLIQLFLALVDQFLEDGATHLPMDKEDMLKPAAHGIDLLTEYLLQLVSQGAAEGEVRAAFPRQTALVLLCGFRSVAQTALPQMREIYAITQQALGIQNNGLLAVYEALPKQ